MMVLIAVGRGTGHWIHAVSRKVDIGIDLEINANFSV
jgi:hypothetical protein